MRNIDNKPGEDTGRVITYYHDTSIAYSATVALTPEAVNFGLYDFDQLTGAMTVNATVTNLEDGDEVTLRFNADGTSRTVTLGTNFKSAGTLVLNISDEATWTGLFDGTNIVEKSRAITT